MWIKSDGEAFDAHVSIGFTGTAITSYETLLESELIKINSICMYINVNLSIRIKKQLNELGKENSLLEFADYRRDRGKPIIRKMYVFT